MRKFVLVLAVALSAGLATLGLGFTSAASAHPSKVGYPNFACVAIGKLGVCVGPPTTD